MSAAGPRPAWSSACISDVGKVRSHNEDACLENPRAGVWVVADGMGGHEAGDVASGMIVAALEPVKPHQRFSTLVDEVEDRLTAVNRHLYQIATGGERPTMIGSTVVALLVHGWSGVCLWAGDSRVYRYRDGRLQQLTQDHSEVEEMIQRGQILREDAGDHPDANVITRAVGVDPELYLDAVQHPLQAGDRFLLCSDGLTHEAGDAEIAERMGEGDCAEVCRALIDLALERGSRDNVTALVVEIAEEGQP